MKTYWEQWKQMMTLVGTFLRRWLVAIRHGIRNNVHTLFFLWGALLVLGTIYYLNHVVGMFSFGVSFMLLGWWLDRVGGE